ncbi:MAG: acetoacetate decarboxylase family protein, partial [Leptospira sp.]|nr:acetoacetate decarboxylase family protein [Leptospira sp.]
MNKINKNYPPPWNLRGTGFVFLFPSNEKYILENGFLSAEDRSAYKGGLGGFVLANYEDSNVGPYYELLFIPGNFEQNEKMFKRITKIYVSSRLSVEQGIKNWAIPKEYADFSWIEKGSKTFV